MHDDPTLPLGDSPSVALGVPAVRDEWGPFRLLARVGSGGFGEVYRAWDPNLEREVALKLLLPGAVGGDEEYNAMLREARAMASVQHPNIVHVYGIDRHDGRVGFWTDFVKGKTLSALLGAQGSFGYREAALIGIDVSRALSAVHRAGLLHRDIKAENVMREEGGRILLMDFGLSAGERHLGNQIAGTPNYMAPELFDGGAATVCSDIYAMGVLLYYLVIAEYPARLTGLTANEAKAALARRTPLMDLRSDLPEPFLRAVRMSMDLDAGRRYASAGMLAEALTECIGSGYGAAPVYAPAGPPAYAPVGGPSYTPVPSQPLPPPPPPPPPAKVPIESKGWSNLFGFAPWFIGLPRKAKWGIFALVVIFGQRIWKSPSGTHVPKPPKPPSVSADSENNTDEDYLKASALLLRPYKESNVTEAVKGFQQMLDQDSNSALAEAGLGSAYLTQYNTSHDPKLLDQAKAATRRAIEMDPKLAAPYVTQARMFVAAGQTALALEQAQKAISLDKNSPEAHGVMAQVYQAQGRIDDAIAEAQKARDLAPEDAASIWMVRLGNYYSAKGNLKDAAEQWRKGVEMDPENVNARFNLAFANTQLGKLDDARDELQQLVKMKPSAANFGALGGVFMLQGKYSDSIEMNKRAVELDPNSYEAWGNLAGAYQWSPGQHDKAMQSYARAIELAEAQRSKTPEDNNLLMELAGYYASSGKADKSLPLVRKLLARAPDDPHVQYHAGETYEILGQRANAIPLIVQALVHGYDADEFQRSPELAALRGDVVFQTALAKAKASSRK
jgi:serine/threonine protein kinase/Tfp pilus assembly protein PilF